MAATASTEPTAMSSDSGNNQFTLSDRHGTIHVVYNLTAPGPVVQGQTAGGPQMNYRGEEGAFTFSGPQIQQEDSPLGNLISVILNIVPDARTVTFTLVLPRVKNAAGQDSQTFETIGVKSVKHFTIIGPTASGADTTYSVLYMQGMASKVEVPI